MSTIINRTGILLIAAITVVTGCSHPGIKGNGVIKSESRTISDFSSVDISGGYQVEWSHGDPALTVSADENLLPLINTAVSGDTLRIDSKDELASTKTITITLSSDSLADVELGGNISFKARRLSGHSLKLESTGSSNISVDGSVEKLEANLIGASRLNARSLQTQTATLWLLGASDADINVTDHLKVTITGAGSLTYSGDPKSIEKSVSGMGSIRAQ